MSETAKRGRPVGTTRATVKKAQRGLDAIASFVESADYDELPYEVRRKFDGALATLTSGVAKLQS